MATAPGGFPSTLRGALTSEEEGGGRGEREPWQPLRDDVRRLAMATVSTRPGSTNQSPSLASGDRSVWAPTASSAAEPQTRPHLSCNVCFYTRFSRVKYEFITNKITFKHHLYDKSAVISSILYSIIINNKSVSFFNQALNIIAFFCSFVCFVVCLWLMSPPSYSFSD